MFKSLAQADAILERLHSREVHLSKEVRSVDIPVYSPCSLYSRLLLLLCQCSLKTPSSIQHAHTSSRGLANGKTYQRRLLSITIDGLLEYTSNTAKRLYCIASDGDAKQRRSAILLTLKAPLPPTSAIYPNLSLLRLFNILCGDYELTGDIDWKHILKHFRNTLLRLKGVVIDGVVITKSILEDHLMSAGMSDAAAEAILDPNDRQDVVLMIQLLNSLAQLPAVDDDSNPSIRASRRILQLLGQLYRNLLEAYMDPSLSLHQQLS